jgi:hypothetical protein
MRCGSWICSCREDVWLIKNRDARRSVWISGGIGRSLKLGYIERSVGEKDRKRP